MSLPSTFSHDSVSATAEPFVGEWRGRGLNLAILDRVAPHGSTAHVLTGVVPYGPLEGALHLSHLAATPDGLRATGILIRANEALERMPADATLANGTLHLRVGNQPARRLRRHRGVDRATLTRIAIIAHRGLSLHTPALMNSRRAIEHAWFFGASGVELDVTVPYTELRDGRTPAFDDLRIHHPAVLRSEVTGFDSTSTSQLRDALSVPAAFDAAAAAGLRLVYLDPKLRWLSARDAELRQAIARITTAATEAARQHASLQILIGAETTATAAALAAAGPTRSHSRIGWAHELTRGTNPNDLPARAATPGPARSTAISLSLLRIRGSNAGALGWLLRDIDDATENRLRELDQPVIFWTAADEDQFAGAWQALARLTRGGHARSAGIITPVPHRLMYFLATAIDGTPASRLRK